MKKTIILAAALVAMTACNKSLIENVTPADNYGFIDLGITADTEMVGTKTGTVMDKDALASYNVTLKQGETVKWTKEYSAIEEVDLKQPAGTYTLYVENLTEAEAAPAGQKGAVRVAGTAEVIVKAGIDNPVSVSCEAVNSRVTVANNFTEGVFTSTTLTITDGTRALPMAWGHTEDNGAYYSAGKSITWTLVVGLSDGSTKTYRDPEATTTVAKKWTQINFSNSSTNGNIVVEIVVDGTISEKIEVSETIDPLGGTPVTSESNEGEQE